MALTLESAARLLDRHGLLREIIRGDVWTLDPHDIKGFDEPFSAITYDTRKVEPGTFLCCKGRFKAEYLQGIDERGLAAYVSENDFSDATQAPGLIVDDVRKAMALLSAEFYGRPQDQLKVVGITGTKGKTTTAYLTQAMLNGCSGGKCALFSSVDNCLDGHTYVESDLTTPESMDAFRMMREAVDNGMEYLVMEVSSQAYKVDRVFGLTFDVAAFLNISPDHISPIEHPTFEDYLHCKRQIVKNCRALVLGADCARADLIRQDARHASVPVTTFALGGDSTADVMAAPANDDHSRFSIVIDGTSIGELSLTLDGDFNYANAAAAVAIARPVSISVPHRPRTRCVRWSRYASPDVWSISRTRGRTPSPLLITRITTRPSPRCLTTSISVTAAKSRKSRSSPAPLETRHTIAAPKSSTPRRTASTISCSLSKTPTTSLWNRSART